MKKTSSDNHGYVTLMAVGDLMLGEHAVCIGHGFGSKIEKEGAKYIFQHVREILNEADITFGNLEEVLSKKNLNEKDIKSVRLRGMPESVEGLTYAGFNVLSLANNHAMEHGKEALLDTMNILRTNGIAYVGPEDVVLSIRGIKVAFLAYCLLDEPGTCCKAEPSEIIENVRKVKSKADTVIVSLHWGYEFIQKPSTYQVRLAHEIIDSGASVILGHHPHVLQGIEMYNGGLIAYSLGSLVCDLWQEKIRESVILKCEILKNSVTIKELIPVFINKNYQPEILYGNKAKNRLLRLERLSCDIANQDLSNIDQNEKEYEKQAKYYTNQFRRDIRIYFLMNFYRYPFRLMLQLVGNSIKKKFSRKTRRKKAI